LREDKDAEGRAWRALAIAEDGPDYKGRLHLALEPLDGAEGDAFELREVRWNSRRTATRTMATMSEVELRRRLRTARGRKQSATAG
jgi:hypothetical protein